MALEVEQQVQGAPELSIPRIATAAAMEFGVSAAKRMIPMYSNLIGVDERQLYPQWTGVVGDGLPTPDAWVIYINDLRKHTVEYLQYPSCLSTRFVAASKLSENLNETYLDSSNVLETIIRLLANPPPAEVCMTENYIKIVSVINRNRRTLNDNDVTELMNELYDFYSIVIVISALGPSEQTMATTARNQFLAVTSSIETDPSRLRAYKGQVRHYTSSHTAYAQNFFATRRHHTVS
jgi:hypothetical protein